MRILVVSDTGLALGLAVRCAQDSHDLRYISGVPSGKGLVTPFDSEEDWRPDACIFDNVTKAVQADKLRSEGIKVIGPSRWSATLESDRTYKEQIIASLGWSSNGISQGSNLYVTGWFNGNHFINTYASLVYRRFMPGGVGPDVQCTGVISDFKGVTRRIQQEILNPLEKVLKKVSHHGCIHLHLLIDDEKFAVKDISTAFVSPLNFTMYDNTFISPSDIVLKLFDETSKEIKMANRWGCAIQLSVPPYPYRQELEPQEVSGIVDANLKHLWPSNLSRREGKYLVEGNGLIGYITARGQSDPTNVVEGAECIRRMYRTVANIKSNDLQYRVDIGRNMHGLINRLRHSGWLA